MKHIDYTYNPNKETASQYNIRIAKLRGDSPEELASQQGFIKKSPIVSPASDAGEQSVERFTNFNAALNSAVDYARQQRKDSTLDFLGGVIPKGALPASSFASVLSAFNNASAPIENSLLKGATDFALEDKASKNDVQNELNKLALAYGQNGGSQEGVDGILAMKDIPSAISFAATALNTKSKDTVNSDDNSIYTEDADGNLSVLFSLNGGASIPQSGGGGPGNEFKPAGLVVNDLYVVSKVDWDSDNYAKVLLPEMRKLLPENVLVQVQKLSQRQQREFMLSWTSDMVIFQQSFDPLQYLEDFKRVREIGQSKKTGKKEVDQSSADFILGIDK